MLLGDTTGGARYFGEVPPRTHNLFDARPKSVRIASLNQVTAPLLEQIRPASSLRGYHGNTASHCFQQHQAEAVGQRGENQKVTPEVSLSKFETSQST